MPVFSNSGGLGDMTYQTLPQPIYSHLFRSLLDRSALPARAHEEHFTSEQIADFSTVLGRAHSVHHRLPSAAIVCGFLALWIWQGGSLPTHITVRYSSRLHISIFGHAVQWTEKQIDSHDIRMIGGVKITSPLKTICDVLAGRSSPFLIRQSAQNMNRLAHQILFFLSMYGLTLEECRLFIAQNQYACSKPALTWLSHLQSAAKGAQ